ncbi:hypothetical protein BDV26DRAFT_288554 [Aspergillus bertholletiae]|uniref:Uncharacterized protein n=1 Tax=Aspergillus bertholletiae TaxID=1226010 RepID=A0A5N7BKC6_9EURO|nr:hypothetical protein BDV26DRAFT_288554 [Aspergillus bertholletiae]
MAFNSKKEKNFQAMLKCLEQTIKDLLSHKAMVTTVDELQDENKDLKLQLENAMAAISEQKEKLDKEEQRNKDFDERLDRLSMTWATEKQQLQSQIQNLANNRNAAVQKTEKELNKRVEDAQKETEKVRRDLEKQNIINDKLHASLKDSQFRFKELQANTGVEDAEQVIYTDKFQEIEESLKALCAEYFDESTTASDLHRNRTEALRLQPKGINSGSNAPEFVPAPAFTLPRALLAQSTIASRLPEDIFVPTCLPSPTGRRTIGEALQRSNTFPSGKKAILRSLLVTVFGSEEERLRVEVVNAAVSDLSKELAQFLHPPKMQNFQDDLRTFLKTTTDVWMSLQKCPKWISATVDVSVCPGSWRYIDGHARSHENQPSRYAAWILFPHILCGEDSLPLFSGSACCIEGGVTPSAALHRIDSASDARKYESDTDGSSGLRRPNVAGKARNMPPGVDDMKGDSSGPSGRLRKASRKGRLSSSDPITSSPRGSAVSTISETESK